jgi:DNA-binding LacI/PurR family transcriptional regulator
LYCFNNTLACFVTEEVRRRGLRVPQELSIMGAGGEDVPGLTCLQVDWYHMGRAAVQVLLRAVADPEGHVPEHILWSHTLRVGCTTAAPERR